MTIIKKSSFNSINRRAFKMSHKIKAIGKFKKLKSIRRMAKLLNIRSANKIV